MKIHVYHHHPSEELMLNELRFLRRAMETMMATQAELITTLQQVQAQQQKTAGEITALQEGMDVLTQRITELQEQIANGTVTPELEAAVNAVRDQAQVVDDLIPDAPPPVPTP